MKRSTVLLSALALCALFCSRPPLLRAQQVFEASVDGADTLVHLPNQVGRYTKLLSTATRLVALDNENHRILFYQRGSAIADATPIKVVGVYGLVQDAVAFDPTVHNRLNSEFAGTIFQDTLYIANVKQGELLRFDLDGHFVDSRAGSYRVLLTDGQHLFGVAGDSLYGLKAGGSAVDVRAAIPGGVSVSADQSGSNIRLGSNRLAVRKDTTVAVYTLSDVLSGSSPSPLFTVHAKAVPDAEIVGSRLLYATNYNNTYAACDLDGNNTITGTFNLYTYTYTYSGNTLWVVGSFTFAMADTSLKVLASTPRSPVYLSQRFLGADSTNLYFADARMGGLMVSPLDPAKGQYQVSFDKMIYASWNPSILRNGRHFKAVQNSFPTDSPYVYVLNTDSLTFARFKAPQGYALDVVGDTILVLSGSRVFPYLKDGSPLPMVTLATADTAAVELFAANASDLFLWSNGKVKIFSRAGAYDTSFAFSASQYTQLFATSTTLIENSPPNVLAIATGTVKPIPGASYSGYYVGGRYWYNAGVNTYAYIVPTVTSVAEGQGAIPAGFALRQNYPNPFNPTTVIDVDAGFAGARPVKLVVYDMLGREVAVLMNGVYAPGRYSVKFDGSSLSSGVYLYKLTAGAETQVRKMLLMK